MDLFHPTSITYYLVNILVLFAGGFLIGRGFRNKKGGFKRILIFLTFALGWMALTAIFPTEYEIKNLWGFQAVVVSGLGIPIFLSLLLFIGSRKTLAALPDKWLTFFQVLRIPIELSLYGMFMHNLLPERMTFAGLNPDLIVGLFAPVVAMYFYSNHSIGKFYPFLFHISGSLSLIWLTYLGLFPAGIVKQEVFIVGNPTMFLYPWIWHWTFLIPVFFLAHAISIFQLIQKRKIGGTL